MTVFGSITRQGHVLAKCVEIEVRQESNEGWSGVFEAPGAWPAEADGPQDGPFMLHLFDGRRGEFFPTRQCGGEIGQATVIVRGISPLTRHADACEAGKTV